jgi:hypothetical protein
MALEETVEVGAVEVRDGSLKSLEELGERQERVPAEDPPATSSSGVSTVERGSFGTIDRFSTVSLLRHFITVLRLTPWVSSRSAI